MLRALVWDVDGTLAETEHDGHRVAFNQAFAEAGLDWHWDEALYRDLLATTGGKERMRAWWQRRDPAGAASPDAAGRIARLHARKTALYGDLVARGAVQLRPGVARLLQAARPGADLVLRQAPLLVDVLGNANATAAAAAAATAALTAALVFWAAAFASLAAALAS